LAKKGNRSAAEIDLTSFEFATAAACGSCHPGGGPLEYDRKGNRYDVFAADPKNNITSGGDNAFDGDYFKARWQESGVVEADCLMCHSPGYDMNARNRQLSVFNYKWAASAGAGIAEITGEVKKNEKPIIKYKADKFNAEGQFNLPIIKEVPTENCLFCHAETDWKKKGTSYSHRFDVHLRAGMKCVECHPAGTSAKDKRINSKEEHNFGKGDDPGALVRDDLDNTMITCEECHGKGLNRAPLMKHASFTDGSFEVHQEKIACQTCHVPQKSVKAALLQDSTVLNPKPRVPGLKRIWSFYGPDVKPWNYYGEVDLTKGKGKPLFFYTPQLRWYKKKIYPVSSLYSIWYGLKANDRKGLNQVFMQDIWGMWSQKDTYSLLSKIQEDNGDGFIEANRPEEIDAALKSMQAYLTSKGIGLKNQQVVLVKGNEMYLSGNKKISLQKEQYEYSAYGSTFKLSHDIAPAGAALGATGCADCHRKDAPFFTKPYMTDPFGADGKTKWIPAYKALNYSEEALKEQTQER
jgi:hypothetical protein